MSIEDRRLTESWRECPAAAATSQDCPDAERIWRAVVLESPVDERRALIAHVATCAQCAENWRIAAGLAAGARRPSSAAWHRSWGLRRLILAAASIIAVVGLGWFALETDSRRDTTVRSTEPSISSLVENAGTMPRDRFLLRWTEGPQGTLYDIEVGTTDLKRLARGTALTTSEFLVPESAFADVEPGTPIAWRVEAMLPDGRVIASFTYVNGVH